MDTTSALITNVVACKLGEVIIEATDGKRYFSNLSSFSSIYCYPKSDSEWKLVDIDSYGLALNWVSRFEVHVDQIIGLAEKIELIGSSAVQKKSS